MVIAPVSEEIKFTEGLKEEDSILIDVELEQLENVKTSEQNVT